MIIDVFNRVPKLGAQAEDVKQELEFKLIEHTKYTHEHGEDMPEVRDWKWRSKSG